MANQISSKVQIGPPKILLAVVWRLIPASCRQQLWADFFETYQSPRHLMRRTVKAITGAIVTQVHEPGYGSLVAGEVCILYVALSGALPPMLAIALALAVSAALIFRDGYMDRTKRGYVCFLWDAIAATALVAGLQFLWTPAATGLTLIFAAQWIVGGVAVSFFRLIFRMPEDPRERLFDEYRDIMQINVLWMVACEALMFTSLEAVPTGGNAFFAAAPILIWGMALRLQSDSLGAVKKDPFLSLRENPLQQEAAIKSDLLIVPSSMPSLRWIEVLFFLVMASPLAIAVWKWLAGQGEDVDWRQVGANAGALLILTAFWIKIRKLNDETVKGLKKQVDEMETTHAGV